MMDPASDHELLRRFAQLGDEKAFRALVERHLPALRAHALARTQEVDLADDLVQETFVLLAREAPRIKATSVISGWLFLTARHLAHKALRSERRRRQREQLYTTHLLMDEAPSHEPGIPHPALIEAMDKLRSHERDVLLLRYFENRSFKDIAANTGGSEESVRKSASRSLEKLRPLLARKGITSTAAALGTAMQTMAATAPPVGMASTISAKAIALAATGTTATTLTLSTITTLAMMKAKTILATAAVLALIGTASYLVIRSDEKSPLSKRSDPDRVPETSLASNTNTVTSATSESKRNATPPSRRGQNSIDPAKREEIASMTSYYDGVIVDNVNSYKKALEEAQSPDFAAEIVQANLEPLQKHLSLDENALQGVTESLRDFERQQTSKELEPLLAEYERALTYKKEILETVSVMIKNFGPGKTTDTRAIFEQISSTWSDEAKKTTLDFLVKNSFISDFRNPPMDQEEPHNDPMKASDWSEFPEAVASVRKAIPGDRLEKFDRFAANRQDILVEERAFTRSQALAKSLELDATQRNAIFQELMTRKTEDPEKIKALLNDTQLQGYTNQSGEDREEFGN